MAEDLQRILECPMCLELFDSQRCPKLLYCQHTLCLPCLSKLEKANVITCPQCRVQQSIPQGGVQKIANNFTMLALIDVHKKSCMEDSENEVQSVSRSENSRSEMTRREPVFDENIRIAITSLAQRLHNKASVISGFDTKETATKETFLKVKKDIDAVFNERIKDMQTRRDALIKQLGDIGKEELNFIRTQKTSACHYLKQLQDDFLKMRDLFQGGSLPNEINLMQLLDLCNSYNKQIGDYALSVDQRTCDVSFLDPTKEQLVISINSYGCLKVDKNVKSTHQPASVTSTNAGTDESVSLYRTTNQTTGNPFKSTAQSRSLSENEVNLASTSLSGFRLTRGRSYASPHQSDVMRRMSLDISDTSSISDTSPANQNAAQINKSALALTSAAMVHAGYSDPHFPQGASFYETTSRTKDQMTPERQSGTHLSHSFIEKQNSAPTSLYNPTPPRSNSPLSSSASFFSSASQRANSSIYTSRSFSSLPDNNQRRISEGASPVDRLLAQRRLRVIGPNLSGRSIFEKPSAVISLPGNNLAVVDEMKHCVIIVAETGKQLRVLGSQGNGVGEFQFPKGICKTSSGNMIISDWWNHRIQIWDSHGHNLKYFGTRGQAKNNLNGPMGVCCDAKDNVYVCDYNNHCIKVFSLDGKFVHQIGKEGSKDGHFLNPTDLAFSSAGEILVTDSGKHCIQVFTPQGTYLYKFGQWGTEPGQLNCPTGIAVNAEGYIFVANRGNHRVEVFNPSGSFARSLGRHGVEEGCFDEPLGISVFENGQVAVCDSGNHRVQLIWP